MIIDIACIRTKPIPSSAAATPFPFHSEAAKMRIDSGIIRERRLRSTIKRYVILTTYAARKHVLSLYRAPRCDLFKGRATPETPFDSEEKQNCRCCRYATALTILPTLTTLAGVRGSTWRIKSRSAWPRLATLALLAHSRGGGA